MNIERLEYWIQKTLPAVYDDSLSMYELVAKIAAKLNEIVEQSNEYFSQDLTGFVETVLTDWKNDGTLDAIVDKEAIKGNANVRYKLVGGAIRNDGTGWKIIDDASHKNINLSNVIINPDDPMTLLLTYAYNGTTIGTLVVSPDETLARGGLMCGGSVGDDKAILTITAPLFMQTTGKSLVSTDKWHKSNVTIEALSDNTGVKLTHLAQVTSQPPVATIAEGGTNNGLGGEIRVDHTLTTTTLSYYQYLHGYVRYDGAGWVISTDNVDKASVSWDDVNKAVRIDHPTLDEEYAVTVSPGNGYRANIITQGVGHMLVQFTNSSGAIVNVQDTLMKFNFIRLSKVKSNYPSGMKVNVHRGYIQCNPLDVIEPFGNFWIYGIHQE